MLIANTTTVVLGSTSPPQFLGSFLVADRIMRAATALAAPASQAILPISTTLFQHESHTKAINFLRKFFFTAGSSFLFGSLLLCIFAPEATKLVSGDRNDLSIQCLRIMALFPFVAFVNNLLGTQILMHLNKEKKILYSTIAACIIGLILQPIIIPMYHAIGASVVIILSEALILPFLLFHVRTHFKPNLKAPLK